MGGFGRYLKLAEVTRVELNGMCPAEGRQRARVLSLRVPMQGRKET